MRRSHLDNRTGMNTSGRGRYTAKQKRVYAKQMRKHDHARGVSPEAQADVMRRTVDFNK